MTVKMYEELKREVFMSGNVNAIEDVLGRELTFVNDDALITAMDEALVQMPEEEALAFYHKYVQGHDAVDVDGTGAVEDDKQATKQKLFRIIPHANIYEAHGVDADDALVDFAFHMDGDMNNYFYSDANSNVICPYDVKEAVSEIKDYAKRNNISLSEALFQIEIRGFKVSEIVEVLTRIDTLIKNQKIERD